MILNSDVERILNGLVFRRPACRENGGCCFRCISGLCPFGYDVVEDCFPHMTPVQRRLFIVLFELRACVIRSGKTGFKNFNR